MGEGRYDPWYTPRAALRRKPVHDVLQITHVDGGTMTQVFIYPPSLNVGDLSEKLEVQRERRVYVIRNSRLDPEWAQVDRRTPSIAGRASVPRFTLFYGFSKARRSQMLAAHPQD